MTELHLGIVAVETGHSDDAQELLSRALAVYHGLGFGQYTAEGLEGLAAVANAKGFPGRAAWLLGAASRLREQASISPVPFMATIRDRELAVARRDLGQREADRAWENGHAADSDTAISQVIGGLPAQP